MLLLSLFWSCFLKVIYLSLGSLFKWIDKPLTVYKENHSLLSFSVLSVIKCMYLHISLLKGSNLFLFMRWQYLSTNISLWNSNLLTEGDVKIEWTACIMLWWSKHVYSRGPGGMLFYMPWDKCSRQFGVFLCYRARPSLKWSENLAWQGQLIVHTHSFCNSQCRSAVVTCQ